MRTLLVIGAGELGSRVGRLARGLKPPTAVTAETKTAVRQATLANLGLIPRVRDQRDEQKFDSVLVAIPPSRAGEYRREVALAMECCEARGRFVLVSSTAVYEEDSGGVITETSPLASHARASQLLEAENLVKNRGGIVIRLAGLYCLGRGPHRYYETTPESPSRGDGFINLIHYEDAASLCLAILQRGKAGFAYLGSDGTALTRNELLAQSVRLGLRGQVKFLAKEKGLGKRCDDTWTRKELGWAPSIPSFEWFVSNRDRLENV